MLKAFAILIQAFLIAALAAIVVAVFAAALGDIVLGR